VAFLGVETSLTGRRWIGPTDTTRRLAEAMAQATALPPPLCSVLARLGVEDTQAVQYLEP